MINEELIVSLLHKQESMLEKHGIILQQMQGDIVELKQGQIRLEAKVGTLEADVDTIKDTTRVIEIKVDTLQADVDYLKREASDNAVVTVDISMSVKRLNERQ